MRMALPCAACRFATCKFPNLKKKILGPPPSQILGTPLIPTTKYKCSSDFIVLDFNEYVRDLHHIARSSYLVWKQSCKPRGDVTEGDMRTSRLRFKYALRQCQSNDEIMRADANLARSLY